MLQRDANADIVLLQGNRLRAEFHVNTVLREVVPEDFLRTILVQDQNVLEFRPLVSCIYSRRRDIRLPLDDPGYWATSLEASNSRRARYLQVACTLAQAAEDPQDV